MGILSQDEAIQRVLASDLPHALQTLWITYATHEGTTAAGMPTLTGQDVAQIRGVGRSTISKQRKRLHAAGWLTEEGRLTTPAGDVALSETSGSGNGDVEQNETPGFSGAQGRDVAHSETSEDVAHSETSASGDAEGGNVGQGETSGGQERDSVSPASTPPSFCLSPFLSDSHYPIPFSFPHDSTLSGDTVEKISTAPPAPSPPGWVRGLPPGHHALAEPIPEGHPARSERHLRYRLAAEWSLRLLEKAEEKIRSFRIPSGVRRKAKRDRLGLLRDWMDVFRLLQEQDDFEWEEIRYAIHWLFTESDWIREGYFASIGSLRNRTQNGKGDRTKFEAIWNQALADDAYDGPESGGEIGGGRRNGRSDESREERFRRNQDAARRAVGAVS